ncbi:DUF2156 domain-containing protein [Bythopirellula polymerisocia]|uniref:Phosphatidylglycerol lysyltransferase n=1 Tax=Bythopirellula polymerisocia TaxID=2528003 RepID=A0A5C6CXK1_9BACT|nr:DUF2156 domain-containing protein [Bythopirellula polymerisocia]TWU29332.1 Phosphatidylglycerol lysyltransferase [Bythopirellula polymerisocia]
MNSAPPKVPSKYEHYRSQGEMPQELANRLRQFACAFGDTYASYLITDVDREYFWASEQLGVVAFRRLGRYVNIADGLLAAPENRELLLAEFLAFAEQNHWVASFMNVPRNEIKMYRRQGCQVTKCGEEALIQLDEADWRGKHSQWLRRQENYCRRHGVDMCEIDPDPTDLFYRVEVVPQLEEVSRDHIASTLHRREMEFFVSQFSPYELKDRRLFVARDGSRIIAFIICNPGLDGDFWAIEVYRRRQDAVRGVIPGLILYAMRVMKAEGVKYVSLSLVPFVRCNPVRGDSPVYRFAANFWWRHLNSIYDVQGIFHFKSRFCPDYREMFLAAKPGVSIRSLLVIAYHWKLFHFNPLRLLKRSLFRKRSAEGHKLAVPEHRSQRAIRQLRRRRDSNPTVDFPTPSTALFEQNDAEIRKREKITV